VVNTLSGDALLKSVAVRRLQQAALRRSDGYWMSTEAWSPSGESVIKIPCPNPSKWMMSWRPSEDSAGEEASTNVMNVMNFVTIV
jgi:hypothetical protein